MNPGHDRKVSTPDAGRGLAATRASVLSGIESDVIARDNAAQQSDLDADVDHLALVLGRRGLELDDVADHVARFTVAIPSWGVGTGGTRFARFPGPGEPRDVFEKLQDCSVIQQLVRCTPRVSTHFPWDDVGDTAALCEAAAAHGLSFDAVNSNTFQDQPGQEHSYRYGSLCHTDEEVRAQAVAHNIECIEIGERLGSKALTVWIADGSNFPGQQDLTAAFDRYLESLGAIYAHLPDDWQVFLEHKLYEPALYSTVIADWGSSYLAATQLGDKARCLVDLGHHAQGTNIEMIVARLIRFGKLAGFHFNDSKYGDDDLDSGSIAPFQLFLIFHELVEAELRDATGFAPAYLMDQSHNVTDPIESLMTSAVSLQRAYAQALLVDRDRLRDAQERNDALAAAEVLRAAFRLDVGPLLAHVRARAGGAIDPVATYRRSRYRERMAQERPAAGGTSAGIV
jgi:L-rhamnose isomerase / sugar isomerase